MTVILGGSLVKGWELSNKNNKVVPKHFIGATTNAMKSYIQPTMSNNPEHVLLHCGTSDLMQDISAAVTGKKIMLVAVACKL